MSVSPVIALRKAIRARLFANAPFVAMLGGEKLYDEAPRGAEPPYALFAETQARDWSAQLSQGVEQFVVVSVISTQRGLKEAIEIGEAVVGLLDEAPLALEDHALIDLRYVGMETRREQQGRFARVNLRFRATTERT
jgi:hypothetical protein